MQRSEVFRVGSGLRKIGVRTEKVRGVKDESNAIVRLADAIAGLIREKTERIEYANKLFKLGTNNKSLTRV